ncbi:unnamed protein product [Acanthoscelides obtectus]|uniref:THAP-type domain-containing protein n=1 Tax=Acanthoscelides obtectus TaxID=200917 RepID=A0A9P0Q5K2_ACAOB|nr:unnamed protein product [Acanthoscelides obtectus]CAK1640874.1 hypothetical protein AOBTE_LOCUS11988 [Acanthoscelides obtectus]
MSGFGVASSYYSCKYPCKNSCFHIVRKSACIYKNKVFHRFPKVEKTVAAWKAACKISPAHKVSNYYVCEDHFSMFDRKHPQDPSRRRYLTIPVSTNTVLNSNNSYPSQQGHVYFTI